MEDFLRQRARGGLFKLKDTKGEKGEGSAEIACKKTYEGIKGKRRLHQNGGTEAEGSLVFKGAGEGEFV